MLAPRSLFASVVILLLITGVIFWRFSDDPAPPDSEPATEDVSEVEETPTLDSFGVEEGRFATEEAHIGRNQTFSDLLSRHGVSHAEIHTIAEEARPVFDVRRLRAGRSLHVYSDDSTGTAQKVVYEIDPINYVVFDLQDSVRVERHEREVTTQTARVEGVIEHSPYVTLVEAGADPQLAVLLSEVFAWKLDFYRIRKGDSFNVVYEERVVDDEVVGLGRILAAEFTHRGEAMEAFYFAESDDQHGYFDADGESLRKTFLQAPLRYKRISSRYSRNRVHPVHGRSQPHLGTDYAAPTGTEVRSTGDGVVTERGYTSGNGNYIKIRHNSTYETQYLHLSNFASSIQQGTRVEQGDVIGYVGQTGLATGPHLCYRFWKNGQQVDPYRQEFPSADPVPEEDIETFEVRRDALRAELSGNDVSPRLLADTRSDEEDAAL